MEKVIYTLPLTEFTDLIKKCVREELNTSTVKSETNDQELLKISDVVKMFRVSKVTIHQWRKKGLLPYHRIASRIYFKRDELVSAMKNIEKRKRPLS